MVIFGNTKITVEGAVEDARAFAQVGITEAYFYQHDWQLGG
jgi:hypothetical protein